MKTNEDNLVTGVATEKSFSCIDLTLYDYQPTIAAKAQWLRDYGGIVCPDLLITESERAHVLTVAPTRAVSYTLSMKKNWKQIKAMMGSYMYENYIEVTKDSLTHKIDKVESVAIYNEENFCFSIPLFMGIDKLHTLEDEDEFEFYGGDVDSSDGIEKIVVVFTISRQGTTLPLAYYDYSDRPLKNNKTTNTKSPL